MMRSMFSAISGLKVHQVMLDVAGNDIANVNTFGYKSQRLSFQDSLSQLQRGASGPSATLGGTNPSQIGLGVQLGAIDNIMTPGAIQSTGNALDVAIQGNGWFRLATYDGTALGNERLFSRAGNFTRDAAGYLVTPDGYYAVGHQWDAGAGAFTANEVPILIPTTAKAATIGLDGVVSYIDGTTGATTNVAKVTLAKFPNENGLERVAGNKFRVSVNSGAETVGVPGDGNGLGTFAPGAVEMSNVDLAQQFTTMITAQRGFQANSRVISAADDVLQELVNLKR